MAISKPGPLALDEVRRFLDTFLYDEEAVLVDEITGVDHEVREIRARLDTSRRLPFGRFQRQSAAHPPHVPAPDVLMVTGSLGCLHAWFFHDCKWDEGWVGFGNRIHEAYFKSLAEIGPPLELVSRETYSRVRERRVVLRYDFHFTQNGKDIYFGDQQAMFVKPS